ncbi:MULTISPECIES: DUF2911 domain-containing protein [Robiginitalea]|uniref:DUF2911 domain-containing protein n=1 Tax=Robiginitalea TaxID=252306 RepID=UPI0003248BE9|nr:MULTISPECIES: DUF2911 domain-containing protein [Robiginitalea]MDC6355150.1 DUF2911 domain-containing protein [Robiginitalea sp. PM2]MDC6375635.1 DUF2911 domain-containing protein [Robiginitalea sp. SP8]
MKLPIPARRARSYFLLPTLLAAVFLSRCTDSTAPEASLTATLGNDTLVIEQIRMHPGLVEAEVLIRSPRTEYLKQTLELDDEGDIIEFRSEAYPADRLQGDPDRIETLTLEGDSLIRVIRTDSSESRQAFAYQAGTLPWMDMVHWPYELAVRQMSRDGLEEVRQPMFTGRGTAEFVIRSEGTDSVSVQHPYRGTMYARTDQSGALEHFDATATTRKLVVKRGEPVDLESLANRFAYSPIGSLSGEGRTESTVQGANIVITFGQPARRGRLLFGGIVPWNERWRTGANRATHFRTDRDLVLGGLDVPAGEYTLFTIPAPDGGTLIVNRETGQNGNNYDPQQDLGRVPMEIRELEPSVENFTIEAVETAESGELRLMWGETVFVVPFRVVGP